MSQSKQSGALNFPLMILAFLTMAGFLYWLSLNSEPTQLAVAEEDPREQLEEASPVGLAQFGEDPEGYLGRRLEIADVRAGSLFTTGSFWVELQGEDDEPRQYLVRVDRQLAGDVQIMPGDLMTVTGTVRQMSDSVVRAWEDLGFFTDEGQRPVVLELESFLEADAVQLQPEEDPDDTDTDDTDPGAEG